MKQNCFQFSLLFVYWFQGFKLRQLRSASPGWWIGVPLDWIYTTESLTVDHRVYRVLRMPRSLYAKHVFVVLKRVGAYIAATRHPSMPSFLYGYYILLILVLNIAEILSAGLYAILNQSILIIKLINIIDNLNQFQSYSTIYIFNQCLAMNEH